MRRLFLGWTFCFALSAAGVSPARAEGEQPLPEHTPPEQAHPGRFDVALVTLKDDWHAIRYHRETGDAWYSFKGDWKSIPELDQTQPPLGLYKLLLSASGENDFIALRLETRSGRSWRLAALKWIEMKVLEPDPAPPPLAPEFDLQ